MATGAMPWLPCRPAVPPCGARMHEGAHLLPRIPFPSPFSPSTLTLARSPAAVKPPVSAAASLSLRAVPAELVRVNSFHASPSTSLVARSLPRGSGSSESCSPVRGPSAARRARPRQNPAAVVVPVHASELRVRTASFLTFFHAPSPSLAVDRRRSPCVGLRRRRP